jgi:hypothetical protein
MLMYGVVMLTVSINFIMIRVILLNVMASNRHLFLGIYQTA